MNDVVLHKQTTSRATERVDLLSFFYFSLHFLSCSHISPCCSPLSFFLLLSLSVNLLIIRVFLHLTFILLNFSLSRLSNFYQHPLNQYCATAVWKCNKTMQQHRKLCVKLINKNEKCFSLYYYDCSGPCYECLLNRILNRIISAVIALCLANIATAHNEHSIHSHRARLPNEKRSWINK